MARFSFVVLLAVVVGVSRARAEGPGDITDTIEEGYHKLQGARRFVYVDAKGREVMVEHLESVPERFRESARPVYGSESRSVLSLDLFELGDDADGQTIYRYSDAQGRIVYTNVVEQVPLEQRKAGALDLSHVSLHSELGNDIARQLREEHKRLTGSQYCGDLKRAAGASFWRRMWDDYAPLIVCGALLVGFLLVTPFALRRIEAPVWARTLTMAIPMLALAGLVTFTMRTTSKIVVDLNARVRPCVMATWGHLAEPEEPYSLGAHAQRIADLKREIDRAEGMRDQMTRSLAP